MEAGNEETSERATPRSQKQTEKMTDTNFSHGGGSVNGHGESPLGRVLSRLDWTRHGDAFVARCPAHRDTNPSLTISESPDGKVLLHCFAGCSAEAIVTRLGLALSDLFPHKTSAAQPKIVATYDYTDEERKLLFQVVRFEPKDFRQRRPDGKGGWLWNLNGVRRVLYRLLEIRQAETIYCLEGEKDCDRLRSLGLVATCNPGGAGKWLAEYSHCLASKHIVILPDFDAPGEAHAQQVARALLGVAASVRIVRLPSLSQKGDVSDWLNAGGCISNFWQRGTR